MDSEAVVRELIAVAEELVGFRAEGDPWLTRGQVAEICPGCAERMARDGLRRIRASVLRSAMTWDECIADAKKKGVDDPEAFCGWLKHYGPHGETKKGPKGKVPKGYHPQKK